MYMYCFLRCHKNRFCCSIITFLSIQTAVVLLITSFSVICLYSLWWHSKCIEIVNIFSQLHSGNNAPDMFDKKVIYVMVAAHAALFSVRAQNNWINSIVTFKNQNVGEQTSTRQTILTCTSLFAQFRCGIFLLKLEHKFYEVVNVVFGVEKLSFWYGQYQLASVKISQKC